MKADVSGSNEEAISFPHLREREPFFSALHESQSLGFILKVLVLLPGSSWCEPLRVASQCQLRLEIAV